MKDTSNPKPATYGPLFRTFALLILLLMFAYPLAVFGVGQTFLPDEANGSPMVKDGAAVGSDLIAQDITSPKLFHPRNESTSASGVDPDITPDEAYAQIPRISNATGITESSLRYLVDKNIAENRARNLDFFAPDYLNVNQVNLDLVELYPEVYSDLTG